MNSSEVDEFANSDGDLVVTGHMHSPPSDAFAFFVSSSNPPGVGTPGESHVLLQVSPLTASSVI